MINTLRSTFLLVCVAFSFAPGGARAEFQRDVVEKAMRAAMPAEATCERGGAMRAICNYLPPKHGNGFAIAWLPDNRIQITVESLKDEDSNFKPDFRTYDTSLLKFFTALDVGDARQLRRCWTSVIEEELEVSNAMTKEVALRCAINPVNDDARILFIYVLQKRKPDHF